MKKTLIILIAVIIGTAVIYTAYMFGYKQKNSVDNINITNTQAENSCTTNQDCIDNGLICDKVGSEPTCLKINLVTGEKYPQPKCTCLNPNKEY